MSCSQILQRKLSRIASHKTTQFVEVFSLESFPLYSMKFCCSAVWRSMYEVASFSGPAQLSVACSTACSQAPPSFPSLAVQPCSQAPPSFPSLAILQVTESWVRPVLQATESWVGAWERGYVWSSSQFSCPPFSCTGCLPVLTSLQIAHNRLSTATDIEELVHCPKLRYILVVDFMRNNGPNLQHIIHPHLPSHIIYMYACRVTFYV